MKIEKNYSSWMYNFKIITVINIVKIYIIYTYTINIVDTKKHLIKIYNNI
jgi:hypothetical protein